MEIIFLIIAAFTLFAAFQVVTKANLVHAALWLIVALFGVAATFVLLNAGFLAVAQVVVYIGAIAVLMIFAIMLTRNMLSDSGSQLNNNAWIAALFGVVLFVGLSIILLNSGAGDTALPDLAARTDPIQELGIALVSPNAFIIPFELASVLLLAALIGAIFVARKK